MDDINKNNAGREASEADGMWGMKLVAAIIIATMFTPQLYDSFSKGNPGAGLADKALLFGLLLCAGIVVCMLAMSLIGSLLGSLMSSIQSGAKSSAPAISQIGLFLMAWKSVLLNNKKIVSATLVAAAILSLAIISFRYEEGGIAGAVFRYDRFTRVVYMRGGSSGDSWNKTDFINLQHAIDTIKLHEQRRYNRHGY